MLSLFTSTWPTCLAPSILRMHGRAMQLNASLGQVLPGLAAAVTGRGRAIQGEGSQYGCRQATPARSLGETGRRLGCACLGEAWRIAAS